MLNFSSLEKVINLPNCSSPNIALMLLTLEIKSFKEWQRTTADFKLGFVSSLLIMSLSAIPQECPIITKSKSPEPMRLSMSRYSVFLIILLKLFSNGKASLGTLVSLGLVYPITIFVSISFNCNSSGMFIEPLMCIILG